MWRSLLEWRRVMARAGPSAMQHIHPPQGSTSGADPPTEGTDIKAFGFTNQR